MQVIATGRETTESYMVRQQAEKLPMLVESSDLRWAERKREVVNKVIIEIEFASAEICFRVLFIFGSVCLRQVAELQR